MSLNSEQIAVLLAARARMEEIGAPAAAIEQLVSEAAGYVMQAGDEVYGQIANELSTISNELSTITQYASSTIESIDAAIQRLQNPL